MFFFSSLRLPGTIVNDVGKLKAGIEASGAGAYVAMYDETDFEVRTP
jgi:hypothetical protein